MKIVDAKIIRAADRRHSFWRRGGMPCRQLFLGVWSSVSGKLAQAENVRAALMLVSRGEAPLGIVYKTDAAAEPNVKIVGAFPADTHASIVYPAALLDTSQNLKAADFLRFLSGPEAKVIFEKSGYTVIAARSST